MADGKNDWIWITGSASGLGRHITGELLARGYSVLACDLSAEAIAAVAQEDNWDTQRVAIESLDICDLGRWQSLLSEYEQKKVRFSHLLNIAGIIRPGFSFESPACEVGTQVNVNLMGTVNGCDALLPNFSRNGAGHIINIASFAGYGAVPGIVGYATSKTAVRTFSNGLAMDLALAGSPVKVSCVCPDLIATPMMEQQVSSDHSRLVFSGKEALTPEALTEVILGKVWQQKPIEVAVPGFAGWLLRIVGMAPGFALKVFKRKEKQGLRNLEKHRKAKVAR